MTDGSKFGATSTTDEVLEGIDLSGKRVVITGGASGLGQETARAMAAKGAEIIMPVRDTAKGQAAAKQITASVPGANITVMEMDLASLDSIRKFAGEFLAKYDRIDLLINNAGVMASPYGETADGFELQFGTNHIGHFLLTNLLMPAIRNGNNQRIVNLSSRGHHRDGVHLDDVNFRNRDYDKWASYGQAKTANILFTVGLEKRFAPVGIHSYAVHPGGIATNLGRHLNQDDIAMLMERMQAAAEQDGGPVMKSVEQGAATSCYAAAAPELEGKGGVYLEDCHVANVDDASENSGVRSYAVDPQRAEKLWQLSEEMVGQNFAG